MAFDLAVTSALGNRALTTFESAERLRRFAAESPPLTDYVYHFTIPIEAKDEAAAEQEIAEKISQLGRQAEWAFMLMHDDDGNFFGKATSFFPKHTLPGNVDWSIEFTLAELHIRLGAWRLTNIWRAAELAEESSDNLGRWRLLAAAACARSLLEGAAYLSNEIPEIVKVWDEFKRKGVPTIDDVTTLLAELSSRLLALQYASRLGQGHGLTPQFPSKNVMTYINKLAKRTDEFNVVTIYEWLCDTVHPSIGSALTFRIYGLYDDLKSNQLERYERTPLLSINALGIAGRTSFGKADPPFVAYAVADALVLSEKLLTADIATLRWVMDDLCLTAGLAPPAELEIPFIVQCPDRNAKCPCGSGRKFKKCVHKWGMPGSAPSLEETSTES